MQKIQFVYETGFHRRILKVIKIVISTNDKKSQEKICRAVVSIIRQQIQLQTISLDK